MTKKSLGRQMRDAKAADHKQKLKNFSNSTKGAQVWTDCTTIYAWCRAFIAQHSALSAFKDDKLLLSKIENPVMFNEMVEILRNDLLNLQEELEQIHNLHKDADGKDKVGGEENPNEYVRAIEVFQHYDGFRAKLESSVKPNYERIIQALHRARLIAYPETVKQDAGATTDTILGGVINNSTPLADNGISPDRSEMTKEELVTEAEERDRRDFDAGVETDLAN